MRKKTANRKPDPRGYGITISFYAQPETYKRLVAAAAQDRRTLSNVCEGLVEKGLPIYEAELAKAKGAVRA